MIRILSDKDPLWKTVAEHAKRIRWRAGKHLAEDMRTGRFTEWERVIAAFAREDGADDIRVAGFCTVTAKDEIGADYEYTPFIGTLYVDEVYRGQRLSERLLKEASTYLGKCGFKRVYLTSDEEGLYEKYGFTKEEKVLTRKGRETQLFSKGV